MTVTPITEKERQRLLHVLTLANGMDAIRTADWLREYRPESPQSVLTNYSPFRNPH